MRRLILPMTLLLAARTLAAEAVPQPSNDTDSRARIAALEQAVSDLMQEKGERWLTEQRATEIRSVVQDVLNDADTRSSLQATGATAGYSDGFFIGSPDGNFKLKLNGQLQSRWAYSWLSSRSMSNSQVQVTPPGASFNFNQAGIAKAAYGFEIRRAKLDFSGHVVDPSWQYAIELTYQQFFGTNIDSAGGSANTANQPGPYAAGGGASNGDTFAGSVALENAYVRKDLGGGFRVMVGQFKSPFLREYLVSSREQLAVERSLVSTLFATGWTQGIELDWQGDAMRTMLSFNDGGNNANLGSVSSTQVAYFSNAGSGATEWAFTGRGEWLVSGDWSQFDRFSSMRGERQGLLLGAAMNWQRGSQQDDGATSADPAENGNADAIFLNWTADATWNLGGTSVYGAWMMNTAYAQSKGLGSINTFGALLQGGHFVSDTVEVFARWEWYCISNNDGFVAGENISTNEVSGAAVNNIGTIGANWYIRGRQVKFTTDLGVAWNPVTFQTGLYGQNIAGADYRQEGVGGGGQIVVRTQLQLLF